MPFPGIERFLAHGTITIPTELYELPTFHDAEISSKGDSHLTSERDLRFQETENPLPSLSKPGSCNYEPAACSPQLYSCTTSATLLQQNVQLLQCACSLRRGPHILLHTQASCTALSHFSEDYLSLKSRTSVLKAVPAAVPQGRFDCQQWPSCS